MKLHRLLSFFLCVMLVVSMLPVSALAEEAAAENLLGSGITLPMVEEDVPITEEAPVAEDVPVIEETPVVDETPVVEEEPSVSVDAPVLDGATSGTCGNNLTWTLSDNGILTISGTGSMTNTYTFSSPAPWSDYKASITGVVLENGVSSIGNCAFTGCSNLENITIPDSITSIGSSAFYGCSSLITIDLPDSITSIGSSAFQRCENLTDITIPDGITTIGSWTFDGCSKLQSVTIPDTVTSIGHDAFYNCSSLQSIILPDGVTTIGEWAFGYCGAMTSITIPKSVTSIGSSAFYGCTGLTDVYYGGSQLDWAAILIGDSNECLTDATIHYTSIDDDPEITLTLADAQRILEFAVGIAVLSDTELAIADVNGDTVIDARDATQILRYVNGQSSVLDKTQ